MNLKLLIWPALVLISIFSSLILAQDRFVTDEDGTEISLSFSNQSDASIKQGGEFGVRQTTLSFSNSRTLDQNNQLFFGLELNRIDIDTKANIPGTTIRIPDKLTGARFSGGWLHEFDNGMGLNIEASVGSLSDKPFKGSDSTMFEINSIATIPHGEHNAWIVGAGFSNEDDNSFVPVIGYSWNPSETFSATIGFPFAEIYWQPAENIEIEAVISEDPEITGRYYFSESTSFFASYAQGGFTGRRFGRADKDDLLNYETKAITAGIAHDFEFFNLELSAGRSMDGKFSENEDDSISSSNSLDIDDSNFLMLTISAGF